MGLLECSGSFLFPLPLLRLFIVAAILLLLAVGAVDHVGSKILTMIPVTDVGMNLVVLA